MSPLAVTRRALRLRRDDPALTGGAFRWYDVGADTLAFERAAGDDVVRCVVNFSDGPCALPPGDVLVASAGLDGGRLPGNAAAWLAPP